jgi:hypothetical protein
VHRYYDPQTGQFMSVDPDLEETEAPYSYVYGDPINGVDPAGDCSFGAFICGVTGTLEDVTKNVGHGLVGAATEAYTGWQDAEALANCGAWYSYACGEAVQGLGVDISGALVTAAICPFTGGYASYCAGVVAGGGQYLLDRYGIVVPSGSDDYSYKPSSGSTVNQTSSNSC